MNKVLSYLVDLLRGFLITGQPQHAVLDWVVLLAVFAVAQIIAGRYYQKIMI